MHVPSLIEKKREGGILEDAEIRQLIAGYTSGEVPDYQMSAMAMAIFFQGMSPVETASLTRAMMESGEVLSFPESAPRIVDKHSTGGIGDKVSLVLAPLLACDNVWVPMISGRGLGITGGTLDKLESIPGFSVNLTTEETMLQLEEIGVVMIGQTADICPADKKLYALRDVSGTVPSQPLIVASIMSKKLAESLDALVLDVKFGAGAFMKTKEDAESLANAMCDVGREMGVDTKACLNPMDEPLGHAVGNALEVVEAIATLRGGGPADLRELVLDLSEQIAHVDRSQLETWLDDGTAFSVWEKLVAAQGGNPEQLDQFGEVHPANCIKEIRSDRSGVIRKIDAETVGRSSLLLGAGRAKASDEIDFSVGFDQIRKTGEQIGDGESLARVHARTEQEAERAANEFLQGVSIV